MESTGRLDLERFDFARETFVMRESDDCDLNPCLTVKEGRQRSAIRFLPHFYHTKTNQPTKSKNKK